MTLGFNIDGWKSIIRCFIWNWPKSLVLQQLPQTNRMNFWGQFQLDFSRNLKSFLVKEITTGEYFAQLLLFNLVDLYDNQTRSDISFNVIYFATNEPSNMHYFTGFWFLKHYRIALRMYWMVQHTKCLLDDGESKTMQIPNLQTIMHKHEQQIICIFSRQCCVQFSVT